MMGQVLNSEGEPMDEEEKAQRLQLSYDAILKSVLIENLEAGDHAYDFDEPTFERKPLAVDEDHKLGQREDFIDEQIAKVMPLFEYALTLWEQGDEIGA